MLDPNTRPPRSWRDLFEASVVPPLEDPREPLRAELVECVEHPAMLVAWVARAVDLLSTPEIAGLVAAYPGAAPVLAVAAEEQTDRLGLEITWCDGSLRRVQAQCTRIAHGAFDMVLSATGFQNHGVDAKLAKAASAAKVPYVRVNRGRILACVQAIAREHGLLARTEDSASFEAS